MRRALSEPPKTRLVVAAMWSESLAETDAVTACELAYGPVASKTEPYRFDHTPYYTNEMGEALSKRFIEFEASLARDSLPDLKKMAIGIEDRFLRDGARALNVDPMLVSLENVVVATSKNFPHRIYLGDGVYGDLQLIRRRTGFEGLQWTYKDYLEQRLFFEQIHARMRAING